MLKIENKHTIEQYLTLLRNAPKIAIDHKKLTAAIAECNYRIKDNFNVAQLELRIASEGNYNDVSPDTLIDFLLDSGESEKTFKVRNVKSLSFDMTKVVKPLLERGVFPQILEPYISMRSFTSYRNFLSKLLENQSVSINSRSDGIFVRQYGYTVTQQENLRAYYKDIGVINIPKMFSNIITVPDTDKFIVWCDYPQADWRLAYNLFIRDSNNAKVMDSVEDAYMGAAMLVEKEDFDEEAFLQSRSDYKVYTLKTFYNSRDNKGIVTKLRNFFMSCPRYRKYYRDLKSLYKFKLPISCKSYFGYEQTLPDNQYEDGFISKGMNTPIQTMTSHVVIETVFGILERFYNLGYSKKDIDVYFVRHDEPIFIASKSILKDAWIFGDCSQIHIDGFSPIQLKFFFGYNYKVEDEHISQMVEYNCTSNKFRFHHYEDVGLDTSYSPTLSILSGYADVQVYQGVTYTAFHLEEGEIVRVYTVSSKTFNSALEEGITLLLEEFPVNYLYIENTFVSDMIKVDNTLIKLVTLYSMSDIDILTSYVADYAKKEGE